MHGAHASSLTACPLRAMCAPPSFAGGIHGSKVSQPLPVGWQDPKNVPRYRQFVQSKISSPLQKLSYLKVSHPLQEGGTSPEYPTDCRQSVQFSKNLLHIVDRSAHSKTTRSPFRF